MALSFEQRALVDGWLPGWALEADMSWGLVATTVLRVRWSDRSWVVKAGGPSDGHIGREITGHERWLRPWTDLGRAPLLAHADRDHKVLVASYLPGELVLDTPAVDDPDTFRQAGELLRLLHDQESVVDEGEEARETARALARLDGEHRIAADVEDRLRAEIATWPTPPSVLVPTHGDWQPRNWLVHDGIVSVIDLGRAAMRPAMSDLSRLSAQDFRRDPRLEAAFLEGYGADLREPGAWRRTRVREAVGVATWAYEVGDEAFEQQGHRMIAEALSS